MALQFVTRQFADSSITTAKVGAAAVTQAKLDLSSMGGDGLSVSGSAGSQSLVVDLASNPGLEFSGGQLKAKVQGALVLDSNGIAVTLAPNEGVQDIGNGVGLKLDGSSLAIGSSGVKVAADGITSAEIADDAVGSEHIADSAVLTAALNNLAVTTAKIAADAIDGTKIADDAVASEHIADNAVLQAALADNAVGTAELVDLNVTTAKLANDAVTNAKIGADAVTGSEIADDAVANEHIADNAVKLSQFGVRFEIDQPTANGSDTAFDLSKDIPGDFYKGVQVFVNGQAVKLVASSPADASEYAVDRNTGTSLTRITFGAAVAAGEFIQVRYFADAA